MRPSSRSTTCDADSWSYSGIGERGLRRRRRRRSVGRRRSSRRSSPPFAAPFVAPFGDRRVTRPSVSALRRRRPSARAGAGAALRCRRRRSSAPPPPRDDQPGERLLGHAARAVELAPRPAASHSGPPYFTANFPTCGTGSPGRAATSCGARSSVWPRDTNIFMNVGTVSLANIATPIGAKTKRSTARSMGFWSLAHCVAPAGCGSGASASLRRGPPATTAPSMTSRLAHSTQSPNRTYGRLTAHRGDLTGHDLVAEQLAWSGGRHRPRR